MLRWRWFPKNVAARRLCQVSASISEDLNDSNTCICLGPPKNTPKLFLNHWKYWKIIGKITPNHWKINPWYFPFEQVKITEQSHEFSRSVWDQGPERKPPETSRNHSPEKWSETLSFDMSAWVDVNCMTWIRWNFPRSRENMGKHSFSHMVEIFSQFLLNQCFCFAELVYAHLVPGGPKPEPPTRTLDRTSGPWTWASDAAEEVNCLVVSTPLYIVGD